MDDRNWVSVAELCDLPDDGRGVTVLVRGAPVALFREGPCVHAVSDTCPHAGASLGAGIAEAGDITCPAHAMHFSLRDGRCSDGLPERIRVHEVRVTSAGQVFVAAREGR